MASLLPVVAFFLLWVTLSFRRPDGEENPWQHTFLLACLITGAFITLITESLSLFYALDKTALTLCWGGFILVLIGVVIINSRSGKIFMLPSWKLDRFSTFLFGFMILTILILGLTAWIAPPNNWDSMTYHMGRVVHWIQDRSVTPYPTNISRQLWQNPFAEFTIAQFQILVGNDRLANFVQWFSLIACCIGVSLIAAQLGADYKGQILAAVISLTIPMGILQSTSTQNDYVLGLWMVCFVYTLIRLVKNSTFNNSIWVGLSLGLAILTKATAYPLCVVFVIFLGLFTLIKNRPSFIEVMIPLIGLVLFLNAGQYIRNSMIYADPFGPINDPDFPVYNEVFTVPVISSNIIRNLGLHVWILHNSNNLIATRMIDFIHQYILGISVNDPRSTWPGVQYVVAQQPFHEDYAGNPLHLDLIIIALFVFFTSRSMRRSRLLLWYSGMAVLAFVIFCAYLRWQPWNSRLQLPLFILWAPFIAAVFTRTPWIVKHLNPNHIFPVILLIYALPWLLINQSKPLLSKPRSIFQTERSSMMFFNYPMIEQPYRAAIQFLESKQVTTAGLLFLEDDWEYPLWVLSNEESPNKGIVFEHIIIGGMSSNTQPPDYIITTQITQYPTLTLDRKVYSQVWSSTFLAILATK